MGRIVLIVTPVLCENRMYCARYRIEGDTWITAVDVAWNPALVGTEQRRQFRIEGDRLQVLTPWRVMPNWADKGETRSIVTFQRASVLP